MLGDLVDLDIGLDADLAPHADDRLDDLVVLGDVAAGGLDLELDRLVLRIAGLGEQRCRALRVVGRLHIRIEAGIGRRQQGLDGHAVAAQQPVHDGLLVDRHHRRLAHVDVGHRLDIVEEDHGDVGDRRRDAFQAVLRAQPVVFLERDVEGEVGAAALDFGDARRRIGDELEHDGLEGRRVAPIVRIGLQAHEGAALELVHHVGAGAHRLLLEARLADLLVVVRRQDVGGEERHPFEQVRRILLDVAGDDVALGLQVGDRGPDEGDGVAGLRVGDALQVPDDVLRRDRRAVRPFGALAHLHADFRLVLVPAPSGQQAGPEAQVGILVDILVEHAFVDRHELRVDRGQAGGRVPGRQRDVIGDGERVADGGRRGMVEQQRAEAGRRAGGARGVQELPAVEMGHGFLPCGFVLRVTGRLTRQLQPGRFPPSGASACWTAAFRRASSPPSPCRRPAGPSR